jgi:hypothetical protein
MATERIKIRLSEPHPAQAQVVSEAQRFNVLCCGRRWGKSNLAIELLTKPALEGYPTGYFAPTYKLLDGTFNECLTTLEPIISRKHDQQFIELITGGKIEFWSLENELAGRSRKYKRAVVDEAAFAKNLWKSWTESIRATLTDYKGDGWFLSTPRGKNDFFKLYQRGKTGEENWACWQMSTYTNPYIDPTEIDDARRDLPELAFNQEYLAQFSENIANPFGMDHIARAVFPMSTQPAVCFGVDLAKKNDWTVITGLDKFGQVCYFDRFQHDWMITKQRIIALPTGKICIDSTGVGDSISEEIARARETHLFIFTSKSKQQLMEGLAFAIQTREVTILDGVMRDEFESFEYHYGRTGVKYEAPSGLHDDCVASLGLAKHIHKDSAASGHISVW